MGHQSIKPICVFSSAQSEAEKRRVRREKRKGLNFICGLQFLSPPPGKAPLLRFLALFILLRSQRLCHPRPAGSALMKKHTSLHKYCEGELLDTHLSLKQVEIAIPFGV